MTHFSFSPPKFLDVTAPEHVHVRISADGKRIWINVEDECVFRACKIEKLIVEDERNENQN